MELFGVQELPSSKSISAPGWAYVPDISSNPNAPASQSTSRKRVARNQPAGSAHENTAKQDAKILRDLAALDKESHKDVQIPIPIRHRDNAGRVSHGKVTPAVRKILQSQKTFANHLSDAEALAALAASQPQSQSSTIPPTPGPRGAASASTPAPASAVRSHKKKQPAAAAGTPLRKVSTPHPEPGTPNIKIEADLPTSDAMNLHLLKPTQEFPSHPGDTDPLLKSRIPPVPSAAELAELLAAPPLTYLEAKAKLTDEDLRAPPRRFCEICGYWGRVKCTKCGSRVCALECLRTHQEDCYTRYGA